MCGIAGYLGSPLVPSPIDEAALLSSLRHRGPDEQGRLRFQTRAGTSGLLVSTRLAIVDLSMTGHQPMISESGRYVLAFNGEIYNHLELRKQLEATNPNRGWRGQSDTESLLACIEAWGVERTLQSSVGMFAYALWDREERTLVLARDRAGEKPIYYGWQGNTFLFGSELKALRAHPAFNAAVDRGALALFLRRNYVPAPWSIFQGIFKLAPGTWLEIRPGQRDLQPRAYWSLTEVALRGMAGPFTGSDAEAVNELERLLGKAVAGQRVADVPLGVLLSGGIDSSLIAAVMQTQSTEPVRTFTIGYTTRRHTRVRWQPIWAPSTPNCTCRQMTRWR